MERTAILDEFSFVPEEKQRKCAIRNAMPCYRFHDIEKDYHKILGCIDRFIEFVRVFNGSQGKRVRFYGGFVRDFLVPRHHHRDKIKQLETVLLENTPVSQDVCRLMRSFIISNDELDPGDCDFGDIDLWFVREEDRAEFIWLLEKNRWILSFERYPATFGRYYHDVAPLGQYVKSDKSSDTLMLLDWNTIRSPRAYLTNVTRKVLTLAKEKEMQGGRTNATTSSISKKRKRPTGLAHERKKPNNEYKRFIVTEYKRFIVRCDLTVHKRFPVNDMSCNLLTFDGHQFEAQLPKIAPTLEKWFISNSISLPKWSVDELFDIILNKKPVHVLPDFIMVTHVYWPRHRYRVGSQFEKAHQQKRNSTLSIMGAFHEQMSDRMYAKFPPTLSEFLRNPAFQNGNNWCNDFFAYVNSNLSKGDWELQLLCS